MISSAFCTFESYVVIDPGMTTLERGQLLTDEQYLDAPLKPTVMSLTPRWVLKRIFDLLKTTLT